ncbi:hypothetical protein BXZ70DRAFT_1011097 [Cristinia sonorae]|uniref:Protein kinase domain-containing protein n=1 Tax=Cristinia sonorae TaxID=1940300 RepID=A0A8K0XLR4_9AGAR|nr:hypothetical protein BXZ70DRAFT_1011097 [Cristinia sonorae]
MADSKSKPRMSKNSQRARGELLQAEVVLSINWLFLHPQRNPKLRTFDMEISGKQYEGKLHGLEELLKEQILQRFKFNARQLDYYTPKEKMLILSVDRDKGLLERDTAEFVFDVSSPSHISDILGEAIHLDSEAVHLVITADEDTEIELEPEQGDTLQSLPQRQTQLQRMRRALPTPSRAAKSHEFNKNQKNVGTAIYNGFFSPRGSLTPLAPPIEIFHPVFDSFKRYVTGPDITLDQTLVENVSKAMENAAEIIVSEDKGNDPDAIPPRCHTFSKYSARSEPIGVLGRQRMFGEGSYDPITKAEYSTLDFWAKEGMGPYVNASCCPTFILATAGAWLTILGFVVTGSPIEVVAQPLADILWLGEATPYEDTHVYNVARVFNALRRCLDELEAYYRGLTLPPTSSPTPASFPYPTVYTHDDAEVRFKYVQRLQDSASSIIFLAETEDEASKLVVKFVDRYGADAHRLLANAGYAPALHYFGSLDGRTPATAPDVMKSGLYIGPVRMVVMEYVEGTTLHDAVHDREDIPANVRQETTRALSILHNAGFVYGDLRSPNVMLSKSGLKLIDFDWAGKEGVATYPRRLSKDIPWAKGVADFAPMRKAHDLEMLDKVFLV